MRLGFGDEGAGVGGAVAVLAQHGADLHSAGFGSAPGHNAAAAAIGGLDHAVARIAGRRCGLRLGCELVGYICGHEKLFFGACLVAND